MINRVNDSAYLTQTPTEMRLRRLLDNARRNIKEYKIQTLSAESGSDKHLRAKEQLHDYRNQYYDLLNKLNRLRNANTRDIIESTPDIEYEVADDQSKMLNDEAYQRMDPEYSAPPPEQSDNAERPNQVIWQEAASTYTSVKYAYRSAIFETVVY